MIFFMLTNSYLLWQVGSEIHSPSWHLVVAGIPLFSYPMLHFTIIVCPLVYKGNFSSMLPLGIFGGTQ